MDAFKFGATHGYTYSGEFWKLQESGTIRVAIENDDVSNLKRLLEKEIDIFPIQEFTGQYLIKQHFGPESLTNIAIHPRPLIIQTDHLLVSRKIQNAEKLLADFNRELKKLAKEGMLDQFKQDLLR